MKVDVVAECVETSDQFNYIKGLCAHASDSAQAGDILFQGYFFSRPCRAGDLEDMLTTLS